MRKRNKTLTIRLTEQEYETIIKKVLRSGMSMTDFLVTAAQQTQIHVAEDTKPLVTELKRIGNNLNQITAKINAGIFHSYNFQEIIDMQRKIYTEVCWIGRGDETGIHNLYQRNTATPQRYATGHGILQAGEENMG